ncbi:hypothetical protein UFOVP1309_58 [uncultured Caudovirales phage]|uniref:Uncharacterized protein n=1 Tax=uncultured Caudovirales phage TaxID=2100421 RepID=A0A6J5RQ90_9CAUD|nr:hypothetical protein UFOVP1309_58 [uncultured Caudovirales phage]
MTKDIVFEEDERVFARIESMKKPKRPWVKLTK